MSDENIINEESKPDWSLKELGETERNNLLGFFALGFKVDRRVNPHLYKKTDERYGSLE